MGRIWNFEVPWVVHVVLPFPSSEKDMDHIFLLLYPLDSGGPFAHGFAVDEDWAITFHVVITFGDKMLIAKTSSLALDNSVFGHLYFCMVVFC